jgi:hypothetical protein
MVADTAFERDHLWCCLGGVGSNGRDGVQSALRIVTLNEFLYHEERECGCAKFKRESKTHRDVHCNADIIAARRL